MIDLLQFLESQTNYSIDNRMPFSFDHFSDQFMDFWNKLPNIKGHKDWYYLLEKGLMNLYRYPSTVKQHIARR